MSTPQANFEILETVTSGYFPYKIAILHNPEVHMIGVMDLNDSASWSGGETSTVFYFMITPEEYALRESDPARFSELATQLQTKMPRNRMYSAMSKKKIDAATLKKQADEAMKEDSLENDEAFDEWRKTVHFPVTIQVPNTPFNRARHALAVCQRSIPKQNATPEQTAEEERLENELGAMVYKAEELYAAYDPSYNARYPYIIPSQGTVLIFSTKEIAERALKHYSDAGMFFAVSKPVPTEAIKAFLRLCESFGVTQFQLDDGTEAVSLRRSSIIPNRNVGYVDGHNSSVRGAMLRCTQSAHTLQTRGNDMPQEQRVALNNWFSTWKRWSKQDLANTVLFCPANLPKKVHEQLEKDHAYTKTGMQNITDMMNAHNPKKLKISHPAFKGRELVMNIDGAFPVSILKQNETGKNWVTAFTSYDDAVNFAATSNPNFSVIGVALSDLEPIFSNDNCEGVLVDPTSLAMILTKADASDALKIRADKRLIFRAKPAEAPAADAEPKAVEEPKAEPESEAPAGQTAEETAAAPEVPAVEAPAEEAQPADEPVSAEPETGSTSFFGRLFGRK